ncbi:MAG: hypothetical protein WC003_01925 [Terrimicrobiaceae bacterium]
MKHLPTIAGILLGLPFVAFGLMFLLNLMPAPPAPPEGSPQALFMGAICERPGIRSRSRDMVHRTQPPVADGSAGSPHLQTLTLI